MQCDEHRPIQGHSRTCESKNLINEGIYLVLFILWVINRKKPAKNQPSITFLCSNMTAPADLANSVKINDEAPVRTLMYRAL